MAEDYISQFYTWVTGNVITAARLNGNITNITNGLSGGSKAINVGKILVANTEIVNSSREATFEKLDVNNIRIDGNTISATDTDGSVLVTGRTFLRNILGITATTGGVAAHTIGLSDNSACEITIFASGLKGAAISIYKGKWSVFRKAGVCTIQLISEYRDGDDTGGYFDVVANGNDVDLKGYTDAGTWAAVGSMEIRASDDITLS